MCNVLNFTLGLDLSGPKRDDEPDWAVLTYNLALAKFQQRHILQVRKNVYGISSPHLACCTVLYYQS
jgi:hypothetical protein